MSSTPMVREVRDVNLLRLFKPIGAVHTNPIPTLSCRHSSLGMVEKATDTLGCSIHMLVPSAGAK